MIDILELNKEQQKAFNALKRAADKCAQTGIVFQNVYGHIHPFNGFLVSGICFEKTPVSCMDLGYPRNTITNLGGDSFADDQNMHYYQLTKKGMELHENT